MPPVGFEPMISAVERLQTYALDRAATGTGTTYYMLYYYNNINSQLDETITNFIDNYNQLNS